MQRDIAYTGPLRKSKYRDVPVIPAAFPNGIPNSTIEGFALQASFILNDQGLRIKEGSGFGKDSRSRMEGGETSVAVGFGRPDFHTPDRLGPPSAKLSAQESRTSSVVVVRSCGSCLRIVPDRNKI